MKMLATHKLLFVGLISAAAAVNAEWKPEFYAGASYTSAQQKQTEPNIPANFSLYSLEALAGANLIDHIAVEGRIGSGLNRDRVQINGVEIEQNTPVYASAYLKPYIKNQTASSYLLLGFTYMQIDAEPASSDPDAEDSPIGSSYGLGISFATSTNTDVFLEWRKILQADAVSARGTTLGFTYRF